MPTFDKRYYKFKVTHDETGVDYVSNNVYIMKRRPSILTQPTLAGTAAVNSTLTVTNGTWKDTTSITGDTTPDYFTATWTGASGTTIYSSNPSDPNYKTYHEVQMAEKYARKLRSRYIQTPCTKFYAGGSEFYNLIYNKPFFFFWIKFIV